MGLLDQFVSQDSPIVGLLSDPNAALALAGTLLQGRRDQSTLGTLGQGLLTATQVHTASQKEERANRQQEIAQLVQSWKILKDQDQQARNEAMFSGQPAPPPNALLAQHEARLSQLLGTTPLIGQQPTPVPMMPRPVQTQNIGNPGALQSPPARDGGNVGPASAQPQQAFGGAGPIAAQRENNTSGMPQLPNVSGGQVQRTPTTVPEMLQGAGIPPAMASAWASTPEGQRALFKHLADVYGPRVVNNVLMQMKPNGQTSFLGGVVGQDVAPVTSGPNGLSVQPIAGATDYFANRAGAITGAQEAAKARNDLVPIPQDNGQSRYMTRAQAIGQTGESSSQVPPNVQAQRDQQRLSILYGERDQQLKATGKVDPALAQEIQFAEQGRSFGGPAAFAPGNAPGFTAGQSTAAKTAAETNPKLQLEALAKSYEDVSKASDALIYTDAARRAVNGQTSTGLFAKPALLAARVGAAFGISDPQAAADPEVFMAMAGRQVMGVIKSLGSGSGISDADREYAAKATGGDIRLNRESINRLLDIQERATRRMVELHNSRVDQANQSGVPSVYSYRVNPPETARTPVASGPLQQNTTALFKARQAIQQGKPRDAVVRRLIEQGFSPNGL